MLKLFRGILLQVLLLLPLFASSQEVEVAHYPFIKYDQNTLQFQGEAQNLFIPFFEKLRQTIAFDNKQIRVLHIGDKELKNNVFLQTIYDNLAQSVQGGQSKRGSFWEEVYFIQPYEEKEIDLLPPEGSESLNSNKFRVYHSPLTEQAELIVEDLKFYSQSTYFKDRGYTLFETKEPLKTIKLKAVNNSMDNLFIYGFYLQDEQTQFMYDVILRSNSSVSQYALDDKLAQQLRNTDVDLIVMSLGDYELAQSSYNSEEFVENMNTFIARLRAAKPNIPIVLITPMDSYYRNRVNKNTVAMREDLFGVAKKNSCALWDFFNVMGGKASSKDWQRKGFMNSRKTDMLTNGYIFEGNLYYNALWSSFEQYLDQRKPDYVKKK